MKLWELFFARLSSRKNAGARWASWTVPAVPCSVSCIHGKTGCSISSQNARAQLFEPEEDELLLLTVFSSIFLSFAFPFEDEVALSPFDLELPLASANALWHFIKVCSAAPLLLWQGETLPL